MVGPSPFRYASFAALRHTYGNRGGRWGSSRLVGRSAQSEGSDARALPAMRRLP